MTTIRVLTLQTLYAIEILGNRFKQEEHLNTNSRGVNSLGYLLQFLADITSNADALTYKGEVSTQETVIADKLQTVLKDMKMSPLSEHELRILTSNMGG